MTAAKPWGGKRQGSGRKPIPGNVKLYVIRRFERHLDIQLRRASCYLIEKDIDLPQLRAAQIAFREASLPELREINRAKSHKEREEKRAEFFQFRKGKASTKAVEVVRDQQSPRSNYGRVETNKMKSLAARNAAKAATEKFGYTITPLMVRRIMRDWQAV